MGIELVPQGTLVARLNCQAAGYPAIYTPTGAGTKVESGEIPIQYNPGGIKHGVKIPGNKKEARVFNGRRFVLEPAIAGDVALVHAWKADTAGNLIFRYTANNYNSVMARNAKLTIVEVSGFGFSLFHHLLKGELQAEEIVYVSIKHLMVACH